MSTHLSMTVIGRLGNDLKNAQTNGTNFVNMSIAHSIPILNKQNDTWEENTVWINATYWGKLDKVENYPKGSLVLVEGTPSAELFTPKDGSYPRASLVLRTYRPPKVLVRPNQQQPYAAPNPNATPGQPSQQYAHQSPQQLPQGAAPIGKADDLPF